MKAKWIGADENLRLRYDAPAHGRVRFIVDAEQPVTTYVVDATGLAALDAGEDVPSVGGFTHRRYHEQRLGLPFQGDWWLVIMNRRDEPVRIWYEVWS